MIHEKRNILAHKFHTHYETNPQASTLRTAAWMSTTRRSRIGFRPPRPSPDEIDACDISSLRTSSIIIEARERARDHRTRCPVSTSIGRPKRVLCPYFVLMKYNSNLPIPRDVPAARSEKGMVYLDSVLEQLGQLSLRIMTRSCLR
jgi:hypothetical protein